jgi:hypothetical protein
MVGDLVPPGPLRAKLGKVTAMSAIFLRKSQVQVRYGDCSPTWIKRRVASDGFPAPTMYVGQSPLWSIDALNAWDVEQSSKPKPEPVRDMAAVRAAREVRS